MELASPRHGRTHADAVQTAVRTGAAAVPPPGTPSFSYLAVFSNCPLVATVLAFAIAQSIKVLTTWYKKNRWEAKQLVGSDGMPSSHSATVTALAVAVGLQEGFASSLFATAAVFASWLALVSLVRARASAPPRGGSSGK